MKLRIALFHFLLLSVNWAYSCTTVFWNTNSQAKVVARTVDLFLPDHPKIFVFPRGVERNGKAGDSSLTWTNMAVWPLERLILPQFLME
jgi:choloylglycine hydrolase